MKKIKGKDVLWEPWPKQTLALSFGDFEILFGGARGPGKTEAGQAFYVKDDYHLNPLYRALVVRHNADDLKDWIDRARVFYRTTGAVISGNPPEIHWPSGAVLRTGHLKDANAYRKYQGHEYQRMGIEELTHIPREEDYLMLLGSCRSTVPGLNPQVFNTTNADGPGHAWVKERWNIPDQPANEPIKKWDPIRLSWRIYIPGRIEDNPTLMDNDPAYVRFLDSLPDGLREQWRLGSWAEFELKGAYYSAEVNQLRREGRHKVIPYDPMLLVYPVFDLGLSEGNEMAVGFFQRLSTELRLIGYYANANQGLGHYAAYLQQQSVEKGWRYAMTANNKIKAFAPHDIRARELTTGMSRLDSAKSLGIEFDVVPSISIAAGIERVRLVFPKLWVNILNGGKDFLEAIRQYRREWDSARRAYLPHPVHDWTSNPADMIRYAAISESKMLNTSSRPKTKQAPYRSHDPYEGGTRNDSDFG